MYLNGGQHFQRKSYVSFVRDQNTMLQNAVVPKRDNFVIKNTTLLREKSFKHVINNKY